MCVPLEPRKASTSPPWRAARHGARPRRRAGAVGVGAIVVGWPSARHRRGPRTRAPRCPDRRAVPARQPGVARRCCSSRGRPIEAAASTCPGGRHCARSSTRRRDRHRRPRDRRRGRRRVPSSRLPARAPVAARPHAPDGRAVRGRQHPAEHLDRRDGHDRASAEPGWPGPTEYPSRSCSCCPSAPRRRQRPSPGTCCRSPQPKGPCIASQPVVRTVERTRRARETGHETARPAHTP